MMIEFAFGHTTMIAMELTVMSYYHTYLLHSLAYCINMSALDKIAKIKQ